MSHPHARHRHGGAQRLAGPIPGAIERQAHLHARLDHLRIVDAPPPMPPVGHVAVLALLAAPCRGAPAPFHVGVLERLAVEAQSARPELVAGRAELGAQIGGDVGGTVVGQVGARHAQTLAVRAGGRPEALMAADVAGRAHDPVPLQRGVERGIGLEARRPSNQGRLLR